MLDYAKHLLFLVWTGKKSQRKRYEVIKKHFIKKRMTPYLCLFIVMDNVRHNVHLEIFVKYISIKILLSKNQFFLPKFGYFQTLALSYPYLSSYFLATYILNPLLSVNSEALPVANMLSIHIIRDSHDN